jgi:hypothetical protein
MSRLFGIQSLQISYSCVPSSISFGANEMTILTLQLNAALKTVLYHKIGWKHTQNEFAEEPTIRWQAKLVLSTRAF